MQIFFKRYFWFIFIFRVIWWFFFLSFYIGVQEYQDGVLKILIVCIIVEDVEMMLRMVFCGNRIVIQLKMGVRSYLDVDFFNIVVEIIGSKYLEQVSEGGRWVVWEQGVVVKFQFFRDSLGKREYEFVEIVFIDLLNVDILYIFFFIKSFIILIKKDRIN